MPEGTPTPEVTPTPEPSPTPEITPVRALEVEVTSKTSYAFAGEDPIKFAVRVRGGVAPYTIKLSVYNIYADASVSKAETVQGKAGTFVFQCKPKAFGVHRISVTVIDAAGAKVSGSVKVPVPVRERELPGKWEKMAAKVARTGDWGQDLVAMARTQLGYQESSRNFIIEDGAKVGYTRYGGWYGASYGKWCAMFVAFCAEYAGIPEGGMPRDANVRGLYQKVEAAGALEDARYMPQPGDLIFFNWRGGKQYDHVGIVESVKDGRVHTIEGNSANKVRRREYAHDDAVIIGYCNTGRLMQLAGE